MPHKKNKETIHSRIKKAKKKAGKKISKAVTATKTETKKALNINRYNKYLFILETILFIGVLDEFLESLILKVDFGIVINTILLMASIGILFSWALLLIEPIMKGTIIWLVRLNNNKILRVIVHVIILSLLFCLYAKVFFGTNLSLSVDVGLNMS